MELLILIRLQREREETLIFLIILARDQLAHQASNFMLIPKVKILNMNIMEQVILKLLRNSKLVGFYCCIMFSLIIYSCNKTDKQEKMIIHNQNGLSKHFEQIIECFVEDYDIQGRNIYVYEQYPTIEHQLPIFKKDISKYVYISMIPYTPSDIGSNRILYSAEMDDYILFYAMDKNREMAISNNLIWKRIEFPEKERTDTPKVLGIIDYKQTHFLYNIQENVIELSHFKSESCKGRLNDEW